MADRDHRVVGRADDYIDSSEALHVRRAADDVRKRCHRVFRHHVANRTVAVVFAATIGTNERNALRRYRALLRASPRMAAEPSGATVCDFRDVVAVRWE